MPWDAKPDLGKAVKFVATDADENQGQASPDGKWIAYTSDETGANNVYIRPFPTGLGVLRVSVDRGREPRWSTDGKWLYYDFRRFSTSRAPCKTATSVRGELAGSYTTKYESRALSGFGLDAVPALGHRLWWFNDLTALRLQPATLDLPSVRPTVRTAR